MKLNRVTGKGLERHRDIAQRAVSVTDFLCIHGFLPDVQTRLMAARVLKYLYKYKLMLVDKGFKDYLVLLPGAKINKRWRVLLGPGEEATPPWRPDRRAALGKERSSNANDHLRYRGSKAAGRPAPAHRNVPEGHNRSRKVRKKSS